MSTKATERSTNHTATTIAEASHERSEEVLTFLMEAEPDWFLWVKEKRPTNLVERLENLHAAVEEECWLGKDEDEVIELARERGFDLSLSPWDDEWRLAYLASESARVDYEWIASNIRSWFEEDDR